MRREGNHSGRRSWVRCAVQFFGQAIDSCCLMLVARAVRPTSVCLSDARPSAYEYIDINANGKNATESVRARRSVFSPAASQLCTEPPRSIVLRILPSVAGCKNDSSSVALLLPSCTTLSCVAPFHTLDPWRLSNYDGSQQPHLHQVIFVQFGNYADSIGERPQMTVYYCPAPQHAAVLTSI